MTVLINLRETTMTDPVTAQSDDSHTIQLTARDVVLLWSCVRERAHRAAENADRYAEGGHGGSSLATSYANEAKEARRLSDLLCNSDVLIRTY